MSKFTIFTVTLVVLICLMFAGLITYKMVAPQRQWEASQQEAIPDSVDDKTTEHATEVEAEAQKTADKTVEEATDEDKNLVVEYGDTVTIDYVGIQDGKEFDGGTATDASLEIGSNSFIPGYEIQLVDHKIGDVVEVLVTFPEDYNDATLAGKDAMFVVTIKGITKKA